MLKRKDRATTPPQAIIDALSPAAIPSPRRMATKSATIGYTSNTNPAKYRRPALLLTNTGHRVGILLHPARGFLWSVGWINPVAALSSPNADIDFIDSRRRVIAIIDDLAGFLGPAFPKTGAVKIPGAAIVISSLSTKMVTVEPWRRASSGTERGRGSR